MAKIKETTKKYCQYLVDSNLFQKEFLGIKGIYEFVQDIIENPESYKNNTSQSVRIILTEYDDWVELHCQGIR